MPEYPYTREQNGGGDWDIDNPARVDGEGKQIHLATEVAVAIPGKTFKLFCDESVAKFVFAEALTSGEESTLSATVAAHKANT